MLKVRCQAKATLDAKGRLALPAPLRRSLEVHRVGSLVLSCFQGAVWAWTPEDFERSVESRMEGLDPFKPQVMDFTHAVLAVAEEVDVDKSGRIRVPPELREIAGLDREVKVFSVMDRIEIWDLQRWKERFTQATAAIPSLGGMPSAPAPTPVGAA